MLAIRIQISEPILMKLCTSINTDPGSVLSSSYCKNFPFIVFFALNKVRSTC